MNRPRRVHEREAAAAPSPVNMQVQVHGEQEIVQVQTRGQFDIAAHDTFLPFAVLDHIYMQVLAVRLQKAGAVVPASAPTPDAGPKPSVN